MITVVTKGRPVSQVQENIPVLEIKAEMPKHLVQKTGINLAMKNLKMEGTTIVRNV
jgi:hypothetical protein